MIKIAIHGVPRSGTSWLGSIFDSSEHVIYRHQPLFSYAFKSFLNENSSKSDIDRFYEAILSTDDEFILQKLKKNNHAIPTFRKRDLSHIIYKEARYHHILQNLLEKDSKIKIVGIIRNPKSVLISWYNAPKEFKIHEWDLQKEWRNAELKNDGKIENYYGFNKWKETSALLLKLKDNYRDRVCIINYRQLLEDTNTVTNELFSFCELQITNQTLDFIAKSKSHDFSHDSYSVYRVNQSDDKWKNRLPGNIISEIDDDLYGTNLEIFNT
jgi:hypothetical protein